MSPRFHIQCFGIFPELKTYFEKSLKGHRVTATSESLQSVSELKRDTDILVVFVGSAVNKSVFTTLPKLKLVATMSTGFDHIDTVCAVTHGIPVCNVPTYGEHTVAEHTLALTLALTRRIYPSIKRVKEGVFQSDDLVGSDLYGKTIGVVGTGHIGQHVIELFRAFGTTILAYDLFPQPGLAKKLGFSYVPLAKLFSTADVVTLHAPLTKKTHHLINPKSLARMKRGAVLINTARGGLIDSAALLSALQSHRLGGAALDVLEDEDTLEHPDHLLLRHLSKRELQTSAVERELIQQPHVIVTPHNAFHSIEALGRIVDTTIATIRSFAAGTVVNDVTKRIQ